MVHRSTQIRWVVLGLAGLGAAAFALTAPPEDSTRFVSAGSPSKRVRATTPRPRTGSEPARAALSPSKPEAAETPAAPAPGDSLSAEPAGLAASPTPRAVAAGAAERRNLFRPLVVAKPSRALPPSSLPLLPAMVDGFLPLPDGSPSAGKRQRSYWQYVGTVQLEGVTYALVEERRSKAGYYVKRGDQFRGGRVEVLQPGYLVLSMAGRRYTMPKATGLTDDSTGSLTPAAPPPAAVAPGQPGAAPQVPGMPMPPGTYPYAPGWPYPAGAMPGQGWPGTPGMPGTGWTGAPGADPRAYQDDGSSRRWRRRRSYDGQ